MNWIDIRVRKPEEKDANGDLEVLVFSDGKKATRQWDVVDSDLWSHWYPLSELPDPPNRIPDPPKGYRWRQEGEAFDRAVALYWSISKQQWVKCSDNYGVFFGNDIYAVPVDPPKPQYRPFTSLEEWWPHRERWVRLGRAVTIVSWIGPQIAEMRFNDGAVFLNDDGSDGTPFGIEVE